eukprot:Nk52_evm52s152 gene=Nk52_evmTU52s152
MEQFLEKTLEKTKDVLEEKGETIKKRLTTGAYDNDDVCFVRHVEYMIALTDDGVGRNRQNLPKWNDLEVPLEIFKIIKQIADANLNVELLEVPETGKAGEKIEASFKYMAIVSASHSRLTIEAHKASWADIERGVTSTNMLEELKKNPNSSMELSSAERMRLLRNAISRPRAEGGAGINENSSPFIVEMFPLHDRDFNKRWMKKWSTKWFLSAKDIHEIKDQFGEKVAFYFAYLNFYFLWLMGPAILGLIVYFFGDGAYSLPYSLFITIWMLLFQRFWERQENELALLWKVNDYDSKDKRPQFYGDRLVKSAVTGDMKSYYPRYKRFLKRLILFPMFIGWILLLTFTMSFFFSFVLFAKTHFTCSDEENSVNPFSLYTTAAKIPCTVLGGYVPTKMLVQNGAFVMYAINIEVLNFLYSKFVVWAVDWQNIKKSAEYDRILGTVTFVFTFLNSTISLFFIAFVHIPFGELAGQYTRWILDTVMPFELDYVETTDDKARFGMLQTQLIALLVTGQVIGAINETVIPYFALRASYAEQLKNGIASVVAAPATLWYKLRVKSKTQKLLEKREHKTSEGGVSDDDISKITHMDEAVEAAMVQKEVDDNRLKRARKLYLECTLPTYDTFDDYSEMMIQLSFTAMFSSVWTLGPVAAFVNNFFELRSDGFKVCSNSKRSDPKKTKSIEVWKSVLGGLSLLTFVTNTLLAVCLYEGTVYIRIPYVFEREFGGGELEIHELMIAVAVVEHLFIIVQFLIEILIKPVPRAVRQHLRRVDHERKLEHFKALKEVDDLHTSKKQL